MRRLAATLRRQAATLRRQAAAARHAERLQHLLDLDRPAHRVLFVRHRFDTDRTLAASQPDVDALWRVLAAQFSRCEAYLLLVNLGDIHVPERRRSLRLDVDDRPGSAPEEWRGSDASWDAGLRSLGLQPLRNSAGPIRISF